MNKIITLFLFFVIVISMLSLTNEASVNRSGISNDSLDAAKQMYVDQIMESIKGKEKMQSDSVFKDIEIMKQLPAERLLGAMNFGFSRALGVGCDHCHNTSDFASNEKKEKQIAREMMKMNGQIKDMLKNIKEITSENPNVTCTTCHRGSVVPATKLD